MKTKQLILTSLFAALTGVGALITIPLPFSPVPITLQLFFTLLSGLVLGCQFGALSQIVYLLLGGIGLPIFAGGSGGFQALIGPTAGYLWGFVLAAFVVGLFAERGRSFGMDVFAVIAGLLIIYIPGTLVLAKVAGISLSKAMPLGVLPFIPGDLIKAGVAVIVNLRVRQTDLLATSIHGLQR